MSGISNKFKWKQNATSGCFFTIQCGATLKIPILYFILAHVQNPMSIAEHLMEVFLNEFCFPIRHVYWSVIALQV